MGVDILIRKARSLSAEEQRIAFADIAPLRASLAAAQKKLNPFKQMRQDFNKQAKAQRGLEEVAYLLSDVEADVDKLARLVQEPSSEAEVKAGERLLEECQKGLVEVVKIMLKDAGSKEQRSSAFLGMSGSSLLSSEVLAMQARVQSTRSKLDELRISIRDARGGLATKLELAKARSEAAFADA